MSLHNQKATHNVVLYFQVHQPVRLRPYRFFDIGSNGEYFDYDQNLTIMHRIARQSYLRTNALILKIIRKYPQVKVAFSISGITLEQMKDYAGDALDSFAELAAHPSVEFLGETTHHSLASLMPGDEFEIQVLEHAGMMHDYFGVRPAVFRNTELIYNDEIGTRVEGLGFKGMILEGVDHILGDRSPNHLYQHPDGVLNLLMRQYRLSDDIAFRFLHHTKFTAEKYISWLKATPAHEQVITLGMDYETFGEHYREETGIFHFLEKLLKGLANDSSLQMMTPSEAMENTKPVYRIAIPEHISWADRERNLSAWLSNDMQLDAFGTLTKLEHDVKLLNDQDILERWRKLQTSDHFYYMSTKRNDDGKVHSYFSHYESPYEAFMNYMNVLNDFSYQVGKRLKAVHQEAEGSLRAEAERREMKDPVWAVNLQEYAR
ncbi:MAG TPA: glycoside hydrolase family 57 protein [Ohtaekwangia sp.]